MFTKHIPKSTIFTSSFSFSFAVNDPLFALREKRKNLGIHCIIYIRASAENRLVLPTPQLHHPPTTPRYNYKSYRYEYFCMPQKEKYYIQREETIH